MVPSPNRKFTHFDSKNSIFNNLPFAEDREGQAFTSYELSADGKKTVIRNLRSFNGIIGHSKPKVQNPERVVIDLCRSTWEEAFAKELPESTRSMSSKNLRISLTNVKRLHLEEEPGKVTAASESESESESVKEEFQIDDIARWSLPRIILHQMLHCRYYGLNDANLNGGHPICTYTGWEKAGMGISTLPPKSRVHNAESYAMLGVLARLADMRPEGKEMGGYTLSREYAGERAKGVVRFYEDITS